jgi:hypothetical protein
MMNQYYQDPISEMFESILTDVSVKKEDVQIDPTDENEMYSQLAEQHKFMSLQFQGIKQF